MRGEKSTFIHAFSEYIDNSVSSYQTKHKNSVDGLKITIDIVTDENDEQFFTVVDNAGGMDDETLYQAIIPNNKKGKSDTKLNQHGIGMKLASF
jgi:light-regulated signal transduction histidine kinase (bacteriophytochrome)